jgi:tetratricopeptide (TPR) repeat protein
MSAGRLASTCIAIAIFLPCASAVCQQDQNLKQPLVTIRKETTIVTEPLDAEGYVDILSAVNARLSEGVTSDNNAVVPLRVAMGLEGNAGEFREQFDKMLGIESVGDGIFVPLAETAKTLGIDDPNEAYERLREAHAQPWTAADNPAIAGWLLANEPALELITQATLRPRFYAPYITGDDAAPQLVAVLLPVLQNSREAARALVARAMLRAGEGEIDKALDDLAATHRLARLVAQDPTLIGGLVAIAIDSMACHADVAVISTGTWDVEDLEAYLQRLNQLPPLPVMAERVDYVERLMFVDVVLSLARGKCDPEMLAVAGGGGLQILDNIPQFVMGTIDWDAMLRQAHVWYDRIVAAMREETYAEQEAALAAIDADLKSLAGSVKDPLQIAAIVLSDNQTRGQLLGKQIGNTLLALLLPATKAASAAEFRGKAKFELGQIAVALEAYRAVFGEYPESLAPLAKDIMTQVPHDPFSAGPPRYQRKDRGFLLYSVGPNGKDDSATSYISSTKNGEHVAEGTVTMEEGDDLVIRVPLPE